MSEILLSAFADEYSSDFTEQLEELRKLDINYIELRGIDGKNISELTAKEIAECKNKLAHYGIKVSSVGSPLGKIQIDRDIASHVELSKKVFHTARELGSKYCRIFSFYIPEGKNADEYKEQVFEATGKLLQEAKSFGITLCHENEAGIYGESPEKCLALLCNFGGELKCVFDMGNFVLDGFEAYPYAYHLLKNHIAYFHIKDALSAGAVVPPGSGEAKIHEILSDYKTYKKDFIISIEPHLQTFDGLNALVGKNFDNPYKYENAKIAFEDAVSKLKKLL